MAASCRTGGGPMIRLSDVKVRLQYRWRVRQRLMVLHFARLHGPTAAARRFGVSVRTIRRWRVRWRQGGLAVRVPLKYLPEIDLLCFDGQPSCLRGGDR